MTSLDFFPPYDAEPREYPEWGTGKRFGEKENIWTPKGPTWQYDGKPTEQYYQLTQLKLSNVRTNDELLPSPQHTVMHNALFKNKPFPAEHPYSSHIEKTAMFPKFDSASDPKRGARAIDDMPKHAEMPSHPYQCAIVSKTKGSGLRREIQKLPSESEKKPLHWNDEDFDHVTKTPSGDKKTYYPWPPKTFKPNLTNRDDSKCIRGNMEVSERTATAMRNVERDQWDTTYKRNHTGLGPANPNDLDNLAEKRFRDGDDDSLRPRSIRTFDPPRPAEGRIARALTPPPPSQTDTYPESRTRTTSRPMTMHEKEEKRLWHGGDYTNLPKETGPGSKHENLQWLEQQNNRHAESGLTTITANKGESQALPYSPQVNAAPEAGANYIEILGKQNHDEIQQMEANNRWKLLELQQSGHDITALKRKMDLASDKTQPFVFYGHEGQFQRERAGMYKTTYDPYALQYSMNKRKLSGDGIFDITDLHQNALDNPLPINQDMHDIISYNRTLGGPPGSVAQLNLQPSQFEAIGPFDRAKALQKAQLQPHLATTDVRTQEGELVLKESTMGEGYNTRKFLQENQLPFYSRNEPGILMSHENQDLNKIRLTAIPNSQAGSSHKFHIPPMCIRPVSAPESSTGVPTFSERYSYQWQLPTNELTQSTVVGSISSKANPRTAQMLSRHGTSDQFASKSSNFIPAELSASWAPKSAYDSQFSVDMNFKNDPRFMWKAGCGTPRPQSTLLGIQDSFTRSEARRKFHEQFPENLPDLRENITRGRKHEFGSMNAQVLRGTTLVEVA